MKAVFRNASRAAGFGAVIVGYALFFCSPATRAQITQGAGSSQADSRASAMGSKPDASTSAVHESDAPQSKEAAQHPKHGRATGNGAPEGAGGFNKGLYGTGTGNNK